MGRRPIIGLTAGDPAGIGPELVAAAIRNAEKWPVKLRVIGCAEPRNPGQPTREGAEQAREALAEAAALALAGEVDAIVTGPVSKKQMHSVGFAYPGQTEFFADRAGVADFLMILTSPKLTVGLVTAHIPLREVAERLTTAEIVRAGRLLAGFTRALHGGHPGVAVAGLNPHAGEQGDLGREEMEIIEPALTALRESAESVEWSGPHSPDTVFNRAVAGEFAAVLCMYHDQGLIPLKLVGFDEGVNVTWGLPFARTSPDHGTAFEIAGKGIARPESFYAAITLAERLVVSKMRKSE